MIDPAKASQWRSLEFDGVEAAFAEAERLAEAERTGGLRACGNWSLGQALGHLAAWASYPYEGYPLRPPWFVRLLGPLLKRRLLRGAMPRGFRLRGVEGGTLATDPLPTAEGMARFRHAFDRLGRTAPTQPNPVFGPLTHEQWIRLNLGHAALHLGYFRAAGP